MKPVFRLSLLLLIATATFTSCKKSAPKQTRFIPKEAAVVVSLNSKSLYDKAQKDPGTLENLFKTLSKGNDTAMNKGKQEWEDFKNSGLDLTDNFYLSVVTKSGSMVRGSGKSVVAAIAGLKDASKLESYIKKKDASLEVKKQSDYSYVTKADNIVAWGKDVVIAMTFENAAPAMMDYDSVNHSYNIKPGSTTSPADLVAEMTSYFNLKEDQTVGSISEFRDLLSEKADGSFWANSAAAIADLPIPLPKLKELTENTFTAATMNFEEGKFVFDSKTYTSKPLGDLLKKYTGSTANLNLVQTYPSNNIDGFAVFSFNPDLLNGIANHLEVTAMANNMVSRFMGPGYTLQDILKAFKGDFAFIVSDLSIAKNETQPMGGRSSMMPNAKVLFNATVGDKTQMNRLLDKLVENQMMVKENNQYQLNPMLRQMGFLVSVDDKNLLISTDSLSLVQYKAGTGKAGIDNNIMNDFKDKSAVTYFDLQKIMNAFPADSSSKVAGSARETFKDVRGYADNFNGKFIKGHYEVRFQNEKENSLTSLLKFATVTANNVKVGPMRGSVPPTMSDTTMP